MAITDMGVIFIIGGCLLFVWLFVYASSANIREWESKKFREANGGEDYVSTAWTGHKFPGDKFSARKFPGD